MADGAGDLPPKVKAAEMHLARIARGQTNRLPAGVTSPLQGAGVQHPLFSPLKRGRDLGSQTICLPPRYLGKGSSSGILQVLEVLISPKIGDLVLPSRSRK